MAAGHFTTISNTAHKVQGKTYFCNICPCAMVFEDVGTFLFVFMTVVKFSVRYELWVNVPAAMFFPTEDFQKSWSRVQILPMMLTKMLH